MMSIELLNHTSIQKWKPMHGDIVHFTGWFTRWTGIVIGVSNGVISIIRAGTMTELCSLGSKAQTKNTIHIDVEDMIKSRSKYEINRVENNVNIWYL